MPRLRTPSVLPTMLARAVTAPLRCSLKRPLHVQTRGEGFLGCLGQGDFLPREDFEAVPSLVGTDVRQVSAGWSHSAAVTADGQLLVWGRPFDFRGSMRLNNMHSVVPFMVRLVNAFSDPKEVMPQPTNVSLGTGQAPPEGEVSGKGAGVVSVSCSLALTAVLTDKGEVYCMGQNRWGQCGLATESVSHIFSPTRSGGDILAGEKVVSMALGFQHVLVLCESGAVYGWGKGERGQLGSGEHNERTAVRVALPGKAVAIGSGFSHGVAILETGEAYVWGKMQSLDVKSLEVPVPVHHDQHQPRPVVFDQKANLNGSRVTKVACGSFHTILRLECGRSFMFGMQADTRHMVHTPIEVTKPFSLPPVGQSSGINETPVLDEEGRWTILSLKREGPCLSPLDLAMGTGKNHESVKAISLGWKHAVALVE